jgi:dihydrofolate reductase
MRKIIVTEWMSLDGTSDANTMAEWFNPYHSDSRAKSIQETIHNCEIMLYGKTTYQMLYPYWSSMKNNEMGVAEKLNKVKKYVVSTTLTEAPWENTTIIHKEIIKNISELKNQKGGNILVQGSKTLVKELLTAGLVDELNLLIQPHIMGTGKACFFNDMNCGLELINFQQLENGVVRLCYKPKVNVQDSLV